MWLQQADFGTLSRLNLLTTVHIFIRVSLWIWKSWLSVSIKVAVTVSSVQILTVKSFMTFTVDERCRLKYGVHVSNRKLMRNAIVVKNKLLTDKMDDTECFTNKNYISSPTIHHWKWLLLMPRSRNMCTPQLQNNSQTGRSASLFRFFVLVDQEPILLSQCCSISLPSTLLGIDMLK